MKVVIIRLLVIVFLTGAASAQELGIRFGDTVGNSVAVDGVFGFKGKRIHADVSFGDGMGLEALYDFIYKRLGEEAFNYYAGVGAFVWFGTNFQLGMSGELGIEYHFIDIPLALGLDWRPSLRLIEETDFFIDRFGLNIRFVF